MVNRTLYFIRVSYVGYYDFIKFIHELSITYEEMMDFDFRDVPTFLVRVSATEEELTFILLSKQVIGVAATTA